MKKAIRLALLFFASFDITNTHQDFPHCIQPNYQTICMCLVFYLIAVIVVIAFSAKNL